MEKQARCTLGPQNALRLTNRFASSETLFCKLGILLEVLYEKVFAW